MMSFADDGFWPPRKSRNAPNAEFSKAIATAIASIQLEVVNRLTAAHPALESEIETMIGKYNRYL
jgi:hypothetical protein